MAPTRAARHQHDSEQHAELGEVRTASAASAQSAYFEKTFNTSALTNPRSASRTGRTSRMLPDADEHDAASDGHQHERVADARRRRDRVGGGGREHHRQRHELRGLRRQRTRTSSSRCRTTAIGGTINSVTAYAYIREPVNRYRRGQRGSTTTARVRPISATDYRSHDVVRPVLVRGACTGWRLEPDRDQRAERWLAQRQEHQPDGSAALDAGLRRRQLHADHSAIRGDQLPQGPVLDQRRRSVDRHAQHVDHDRLDTV